MDARLGLLSFDPFFPREIVGGLSPGASREIERRGSAVADATRPSPASLLRDASAKPRYLMFLIYYLVLSLYVGTYVPYLNKQDGTYVPFFVC